MNREAPITHPDDANPKETTESRPDRRTRSRLLILLSVLAAIAVLAISIGVGVGVGKRQSSNTSPSTTTSATIDATTSSTIPTASVILTDGAVNDSSISAVLSSDGDRHLFFQDIKGNLRHAMFSQSSNDWLTSIDSIDVQRQPKYATPISALQTVQPVGNQGFNIFYIDVDNTVAAVQWSPQGDAILDPSGVFKGSFSVWQATRSIPIFRLVTNASQPSTVPSNASMNSIDEALLFFETATRNITVLQGIISFQSSGGTTTVPDWAWNDVTGHFTAAFERQYDSERMSWLAAPFSVIHNQNSGIIGEFLNGDYATAGLEAGAYTFGFALQNTSLDSIVSTDGAPNGIDNTTSLAEASISLLSNDTDLIPCFQNACFVNNATLYICSTVQCLSAPVSTFPFGRLALISSGSTSYVYHQMNQNLFREEIHDDDANQWTKSNEVVIQIQ